MQKKNNSQTRILVFGTFDVMHPGHINFFKQARKLAKNPYLIVSVARDANVKRIKGKKPFMKESRRLEHLKKNKLVDLAVLGGKNQHLPHIVKLKPDLIALGYDQKAYVDNLREDLLKLGLKVRIRRMKAYKPNFHKSSLLKLRKPSNYVIL
ncbi:MAG: FAD synthase [Candidatus Doudnabacteria bacterium]|nr:FAD synthase [Candidatus Doudnabacteria bacterium]